MVDGEPVSQALPPSVVDAVRVSVHGLLEQTPEFSAADGPTRRRLAERMVRVSLLGAQLVEDERRQTSELQGSKLARGLEAPPSATGRAAQAVGDLKAALDFPTYVQSLITGVFQAITRSNLQQLESIADMLDHVSASAESFASENVTEAAARQWISGRTPALQLRDGTLQLREGAELDRARLQETLDASESEVGSIDEGDLDGTLLPLVRRRMGRDRQSVLATMVQMGMQRIVVDEGQLTAQMEMRVDARSVEQQ